MDWVSYNKATISWDRHSVIYTLLNSIKMLSARLGWPIMFIVCGVNTLLPLTHHQNHYFLIYFLSIYYYYYYYLIFWYFSQILIYTSLLISGHIIVGQYSRHPLTSQPNVNVSSEKQQNSALFSSIIGHTFKWQHIPIATWLDSVDLTLTNEINRYHSHTHLFHSIHTLHSITLLLV